MYIVQQSRSTVSDKLQGGDKAIICCSGQRTCEMSFLNQVLLPMHLCLPVVRLCDSPDKANKLADHAVSVVIPQIILCVRTGHTCIFLVSCTVDDTYTTG